MRLEWKFYDPSFEYNDDFKDYRNPTCAWLGHIFFGYDLVRNFRPKRIVELGTYRGTSLFSFLQAEKDGGGVADVSGVDTWEGDKHTGYYSDVLYKNVRRIVDKYYDELDVHLLKMTFDEAHSNFEEGTIDLLHIDGLHTYEAVKHDYQTWLPKVSPDGIIIMHDIAVDHLDFGVKKFWAEIQSNSSEEYDFAEMYHSNGLGVIFMGESKKLAKEFMKTNFDDHYREKYFVFLGSKYDEDRSFYAKLQKKAKTLKDVRAYNKKLIKENKRAWEYYYNIKNRKIVKLLNYFLSIFNKQI